MTASVSRIGKVPRAPVVELEGMGSVAVAGVDFDYAPWGDRSLTLEGVCGAYVREHVIPRGSCPKRAGIGLLSWLHALGPDRDVRTLTRADGRTVIDYDRSHGRQNGTVIRNLAMGIAALNHAKREERLDKVPKFQKPEPPAPRSRWLTPEEYRRLELLPKPPRIHKFIVMAYHTGARAKAIEELRWERVDFERNTIDFRVPGVTYRNKRRVVAEMTPKLAVRMRAWYERRADDYVIGLSARGTTSSTYNGVKDAMRQIGIDERGVARHVARHTFASLLLQNDVPIFTVADLLGDQVEMISKVYGHMSREKRTSAVSALPL